MSEYAIEARGIGKTYGQGALAFRALTDVDFLVTRGEFVMLRGPSGSGKTTLLSILGCVLRPTEGSLKLFGRDVSNAKESQLPALRLGMIGFIFQGHNLVASLSAQDNVALVLELRGQSRKQSRAEAARLLTLVGLGDKVDRKPSDLSGGQRQRVAIARAIAGNPPLIFADEPTASLDATSGLQITELLRELAKELGCTVVVVTHDNRIFHLADRMVSIEDGRIVPEDSLAASHA
ncbi:MAG: ABC transporter ATP-binding protein [Deltaproteobacteria bacterium]|nr:ABC transporter ATP-binding protein [Deltaproteobacteria bacterium]